MDVDHPKKIDDVTRMLVIGALGGVLGVHLVNLIFGGAGLFTVAPYADADVYMWLNRVEALAEGRGWFDHVEPRVFPPEGHVQHWTRPLDLILLVGAYALSPFFEFRDALLLWGNLLSPLLLFVAGWLVYRLGRLLLARREAVITASLFVLYPSILMYYAWGRSDHHSLLSLGQVVFVLGVLSFFLFEKRRVEYALVTGLVGAMAVWVNVEALSYVIIGMAFLGAWWLIGRRNLIRANVAMSGGLFGGTILAVLVERGPDFFVVYPVDTIGISYVALFGLTWLFWIGLWAWTTFCGSADGLRNRLFVAVLLAAGVLGGLVAIDPAFFQGPFAQVDELYREVRLEQITEQLPLLRPGYYEPLEMVGRGIGWIGIVVVGLVGSFWKIRDTESLQVQWVWGMMSLMALLYVVLSLETIRWTYYVPLGAAPGFAVVAGKFLAWIEEIRCRSNGGMFRTNVLRPVAVACVLGGLPALSTGLQACSTFIDRSVTGELHKEEGDDVFDEDKSCDLRKAAQAVDDLDELGESPMAALTPDRTAEWMFRTDHSVTAIANHRVQPGFELFVDAMASRDVIRSHDMLADHGVDLVMVCQEQSSRLEVMLRDGGEATIERLLKGQEVGPFRLLVDPEETRGWSIYGVKPR